MEVVRQLAEGKAKSFMLEDEVTVPFAEACKKAGVSQAGQITKMMLEFIEEVNSREN